MTTQHLFSRLLVVAALSSVSAFAQMAPSNVTISDAWARATVPGQKASGAFMKLTAKESVKLVSVSSPAAAVAEIHEMKMDKDVMKMAALPNGVELPAGKAVELKPGGYHVMLMDLKAPLTKDSTVPLTLVFEDAKGVKTPVDIKIPVSAQTPMMGQGMGHSHGDHKH